MDVDRVIFACPANAVGNILKGHGPLEDAILSTPVYADDHHPATGHMHAVMHSDPSVRDDFTRPHAPAQALSAQHTSSQNPVSRFLPSVLL